MNRRRHDERSFSRSRSPGAFDRFIASALGPKEGDGAVKVAGPSFPVTQEMVDDAVAIRGVVAEQLDRLWCPWRWPDRNPFPTVTLFPRSAKVGAWVREARARLRGAMEVLRYGEGDEDQ